MKWNEFNEYAKNYPGLTLMNNGSGVWGITVDNRVVYVQGNEEGCYNAAKYELFKVENWCFQEEDKYRLLYAAKIGGHDIDAVMIWNVPKEEVASRVQTVLNFFPTIFNFNVANEDGTPIKYKVEDLINSEGMIVEPDFHIKHSYQF